MKPGAFAKARNQEGAESLVVTNETAPALTLALSRRERGSSFGGIQLGKTSWLVGVDQGGAQAGGFCQSANGVGTDLSVTSDLAGVIQDMAGQPPNDLTSTAD